MKGTDGTGSRTSPSSALIYVLTRDSANAQRMRRGSSKCHDKIAILQSHLQRVLYPLSLSAIELNRKAVGLWVGLDDNAEKDGRNRLGHATTDARRLTGLCVRQ